MGSPKPSEVERKLELFIVEELLAERFETGDPLATEALDSLGVEQLIEFIEEEFDVRIADEEMARKNFESLPTLAAFVEAKRRASRA